MLGEGRGSESSGREGQKQGAEGAEESPVGPEDRRRQHGLDGEMTVAIRMHVYPVTQSGYLEANGSLRTLRCAVDVVEIS